MKQYLLLCDEVGKALLENILSNKIQFLEVQGMNMQGGQANVLVTPIIPPVTPMVTAEDIIPMVVPEGYIPSHEFIAPPEETIVHDS